LRPVLTTTLVLCMAPAVMAQESAAPSTSPAPPETSLPPEPRPESLGSASVERLPDSDETEPGGTVPENDVTVVDNVPPVSERIAEDPEALKECYSALRALGTAFEEAEAITNSSDAACGIEKPVRVTALPGDVELRPAGHMRCETALALSRWTKDHATPAAEYLPERGPLVAIEHGSTYICRRRNNLPTGELSEHAYGNAVDIMGFQFETGAPIAVEPRERDGTMAEAFQDAVRATACLNFTTVLGPGSDASHADHLHLDVKSRRNDFRLCQ